MIFPKIRPIIPVAPVKYIDIDAIITHSQTDRRAKIDSYISVTFPDEQAFLFFKKGELYSSGRIVNDKFMENSIINVIKRIKEYKEKEEDASFTFNEIDDILLKMLLNKFYSEPLYKNINSKYTDIQKLFNTVLAQKNKFTGFIEFIYQNTLNFIIIENGILNDVKFCEILDEYLQEAVESNDINILMNGLAILFSKEKNGVYINIFGDPVEIPPQLSLYEINLMEKVIKSIIEKLSNEISPTNIIKYFEGAQEKISKKIPEFKNAIIKKDIVDLTNINISKDAFIDSVSLMVNDFIDKLNLLYPGVAVMKVFEAIKDFRFVLDNIGFFKKSYLKSMM